MQNKIHVINLEVIHGLDYTFYISTDECGEHVTIQDDNQDNSSTSPPYLPATVARQVMVFRPPRPISVWAVYLDRYASESETGLPLVDHRSLNHKNTGLCMSQRFQIFQTLINFDLHVLDSCEGRI